MLMILLHLKNAFRTANWDLITKTAKRKGSSPYLRILIFLFFLLPPTLGIRLPPLGEIRFTTSTLTLIDLNADDLVLLVTS